MMTYDRLEAKYRMWKYNKPRKILSYLSERTGIETESKATTRRD